MSRCWALSILLLLAWLALALGFAPPEPAAQGPPKTIAGADGAPMVLVPAGEFLMGSTESQTSEALSQCNRDYNNLCMAWQFDIEKPQRRVYLGGFYIDKYPVTNARFRAAGMTPDKDYGSKFNGSSQPVVGVTWRQARDYCAKVGKRLPSEAEWEKAARGTDGRKFPWGNDWDPDKAIWYMNSDYKPHPVDRSYNTHESPYGAVDMAGNVLEWVQDRYSKDYYRQAPGRNPKGPGSGIARVMRGGSAYNKFAGNLRAALRLWNYAVDKSYSLGFRCAKGLN